jgi:hypothetical protein
MVVVAGPPGSGKSTLYPVSGFGIAFFNADDRAAELNGGSYVGITSEIRTLVSFEFEAFILSVAADAGAGSNAARVLPLKLLSEAM